jgi:hypothetical protein
MPNFDTTAAAVIIPTEKIEATIDGFGYPSLTGLLIAAGLKTKGSIAVRMPRFSTGITVPAGTKVEAADFTEAVPAMAEGSLTPGIVGFEIPVTDETMEGTITGITAELLSEAVLAMSTRMDSDIHTVANSATHVQGAITDVFNRSKVTAAAAAWRALNVNVPGARTALVVGSQGQTELETDELVSAATRSVGDFAVVSDVSGYLGMYGKLALFSAGTQLATEGGGNSNYMTLMGDGKSGIAIGVSRKITIEANRGTEGARAGMNFYVVNSWYGVGPRNVERLLQVLSRSAA